MRTHRLFPREQNFELEQLCTLQGHENEVKSVAWDPSGNLVATCR